MNIKYDIDMVFVCDYYGDCIYIVEYLTGLPTIVGKISLPTNSKPYGLVNNSANNTVTATLSGLNLIITIDRSTGDILDTNFVGTQPMGVCLDKNQNRWVANYGSDSVSVVANDGTITDIVVGDGPLELWYDGVNDEVWISNSKENTITIINATTKAKQTITVGDNPWGLFGIQGYVYVANSYSDTVSQIDIQTKQIVNTIQTDISSVPYIISYVNDKLYVACYGDSSIKEYTSGVLTSIYPVNNVPFGIASDNANQRLWIVDYYTLPTVRYEFIKDTPTEFSFLGVIQSDFSTLYESNEIVISGLDVTDVPATIPSVSGCSIIKNDVNVGFGTTVVNGDRLKLHVLSGSTYNNETSTVLTIGNTSAKYSVTTVVYDQFQYDDLATSFYFTPVTGATTSTSCDSNVITVAGLKAGYSIPISASNGIILKNGTPSGQSTTIQNGDTVQIRLVSGSTTNEAVYSVVTVGNTHLYKTSFVVLTSGYNNFAADGSSSPSILSTFPLVSDDQEISTVVSSVEFDVSGLLSNRTISIDPIPGNYILVNGVNKGQSTTVTPTSNIKIVSTSSDYNGYSTVVYVCLGPDVYQWTISTVPNIQQLIFQDQPAVSIGEVITSNVVTIKGIPSNKQYQLYSSSGEVYVNGQVSNTISTGDLVYVKLRVVADINTYQIYTIINQKQVTIGHWKVGGKSTSTTESKFSAATGREYPIVELIGFTLTSPQKIQISATYIKSSSVSNSYASEAKYSGTTSVYKITNDCVLSRVNSTNVLVDVYTLTNKPSATVLVDAYTLTNKPSTSVLVDLYTLTNKPSTSVSADIYKLSNKTSASVSADLYKLSNKTSASALADLYTLTNRNSTNIGGNDYKLTNRSSANVGGNDYTLTNRSSANVGGNDYTLTNRSSANVGGNDYTLTNRSSANVSTPLYTLTGQSAADIVIIDYLWTKRINISLFVNEYTLTQRIGASVTINNYVLTQRTNTRVNIDHYSLTQKTNTTIDVGAYTLTQRTNAGVTINDYVLTQRTNASIKANDYVLTQRTSASIKANDCVLTQRTSASIKANDCVLTQRTSASINANDCVLTQRTSANIKANDCVLTQRTTANVTVLHPEYSSSNNAHTIDQAIITCSTTNVSYSITVPEVVLQVQSNHEIDRSINHASVTNIITPTNIIKTNVTNIIQLTNVTKTSINSIQFKAYEPLVWDPYVFEDTVIENNGTFKTAEEAIAAGLSLGYSQVESYQLKDGSYIWTSSECLIVPTTTPTPTNPPQRPRVLYGWKQGG